MRGKNEKLTIWAMIFSCVVLALVGWLAVRTILSLREANQQVVHTQEVLMRMERLRYDLRELESAGRGYMLVPRPEFLAQVGNGRQAIERGLDELGAFVRDNTRQSERLEDLKPLIAYRLGLVANAVASREVAVPDEEELVEILAAGLQAMTQVMARIDALEQHEVMLLRMRVEKAEARLHWVYAAIGGGFSLSLVLMCWPILWLRAEIRAREKAHRQLLVSSERIQDLYNKAPCGYFSVSGSGLVTAMNDTLLHWLGLERPGLNRLMLENLCPPEMRAEVVKWLHGSDTSHAMREREMEFLGKDGRRIPVWLSAAQAGPGASEWRITAVDITERKRAEAVTARARDQAESIVNTVRQPLVVLTETLRVSSTNLSFQQAFNTTPEQTDGRAFSGICGGLWAVPELLRALEDVLPGQKAVENFPVSLNMPRKGRRLFELNARKLYRPGNHTSLTLLAIEDVTERRQMEDVHRQFRALFESIPGRYLVLSPDGAIAAVSNAFLEATATTRDAIIGRNVFEVFPDQPSTPGQPSTMALLRDSLRRVEQTAAPDVMPLVRYDIPGPGGALEQRYWSSTNSPVFGADGKIEYIIDRADDVTELVRAGQLNPGDGAQFVPVEQAQVLAHSRELGAANSKLRALNEELEAFSYSVSHDLRAPLRHIAGFAEMLSAHAAESLDDKSRRYLGTIIDSAGRMGELIDDLLLFSRVGRSEMRHQKVSLSELAASARDSFRTETEGRVIEWAVEALPDVEGDAAMLRQVFANLLGNAVKYTRKQPAARIAVTAKLVDGGLVEIGVQDNGAGFDMKYAAKLFGVFQRLHSASEFEGTGVGLALVRRIVQRHGGNIRAEGAVGTGASFYFTLPLAVDNAAKPQTP